MGSAETSEIITNFVPIDEGKTTSNFIPIPGSKGEEPLLSDYGETYLMKGEPISVVDKVMDYLGIRPTVRKTTPLELEATERGVLPFQVREEVFGTGRSEELRKVFQRGLASASFGMTDLVSKMLTGEIEHPETTVGTIGEGAAGVAGFILGPYNAAKLITGTRLAPTANGMWRVAQMMAKGGADLGIASGLSNIVPSLLESEDLTEAGLKVGKSTAIGTVVGATFPTLAFVPTEPLRLAVGLAVMDKIRSGFDEWFTIDDVITGIANGQIDQRELALKTFDYLLDLYFIAHVPSMKKQLNSFKHNDFVKEISKINADEVERTIVQLEKDGLIPGSEKRETSRIDDITKPEVLEALTKLTEEVKTKLEAEGRKMPEEVLREKLREPVEEVERIAIGIVPGRRVDWMEPGTSVEFFDDTVGKMKVGVIESIKSMPDGTIVGATVKSEGKTYTPRVDDITGPMKEVKPELSPTEKDQFKLPGMKVGVEFGKEGKEAPTLEKTPLMESALAAEREKKQGKLELEKEPEIIEEDVITAREIERIRKEVGVQDIVKWVRDKGGLSLTSKAADVFELTQKESGFRGRSAIVRKGGRAADVLRDEAEWEGIIPKGTSTDEFVDMIKARVSSYASVGKYQSSLPTIMDLPEIVKLGKELMGGKYPEIREKLRAMKGAATGVFWPKEGGKIGLKAELFKDIDQARWTLSHEIGHLVDYLPDAEMKRGNILGRIATLKKYMKEMIEEAPPSLEHWLLKEEGQKEWKKIRARIRKEARQDAKEEGIDPKEDKEMFNDFVSGRYKELKDEWIAESGFISKQEITGELKNLTQAIKPFDEIKDDTFTKYRYSSKELYADALSSLVNNPYLMKESAPLFYDSFFNYLERKPEVKRLYEEIQDSIKGGTNQPERVKELRESFRSGDEKYYESIRKEPKMLDSVKAALIDKHHFIIKRIKQSGEKNLAPGDNPRYKLEEMDYRVAEHEAYLIDIYNQVIKPIEKAGASWEDFREWAFHERIINERGEIANPMGWHPDRSKQRIAEMKATMPLQMTAIEQAHKQYWDIRKSYFIDNAERLNIFGKELMDKIKDNEFYATFDVQNYFNDAYGRTVGPKIYSQIGTLQEIGDPIAATIMKDISLMGSISRLKASRSVIDLFKKNFPDEITDADTQWMGKGRRILEPKEKGQFLLVDMQEGKAKGYYLPEEIGLSFEQNPLQAGIIARILRKTVQPFRMAFVELNYGFWMFNIHRDYFRAAKNLPEANVTNFAKYWLEGIKPAFKGVFGIPDPVSQEMLKGDMLISIADTRGMRPEDMQIERLLKKYHVIENEWKLNVLKPFGKLFNFFTNIGRGFERATKVASYEYLKDKFPQMSEEEIGHIVRSMGGSPDFLRKGTGYDLYNNILLFSNAMKEGYRGDYEALSNSPAGFMWKMAKYNFLPKLLMKAAAIGLLGAGVKEIYDKATEYDKTNYVVIPLGTTATGKAVYWRIPQDETGRLLGGVLWKLLGADFEPMKGGLIDYMAGQAPTVHPMLDVMVDVVEYYSGNNPYDSFRGQTAIPELTWKAQDFRTTEAFAKYIANKIGVGLVHRFKSDNDVEIRGELEKLINYPILSNILGRFIKVTDYGEKEHIRQDILEPIQRERARELLDFREAIQKSVRGERLTEEDATIIMKEAMRNPDVISRNIIVNFSRRYGSAYLEAWVTASTKEEKMAILKELMQKQGEKP